LQSPLQLLSPSILAPDQDVGISHHNGGCGSRSPTSSRLRVRPTVACIACASSPFPPFSSLCAAFLLNPQDLGSHVIFQVRSREAMQTEDEMQEAVLFDFGLCGCRHHAVFRIVAVLGSTHNSVAREESIKICIEVYGQ
jgi:hypothetical protein